MLDYVAQNLSKFYIISINIKYDTISLEEVSQIHCSVTSVRFNSISLLTYTLYGYDLYFDKH